MRSVVLLVLLTLTALLACEASAAERYTVQSIVRTGDVVGDVVLGESSLPILGLNDRGQVAFLAGGPAGTALLLDAGGGRLTSISRTGDRTDGFVVNGLDAGYGPSNGGHLLFIGTDVDGIDALFQYTGGRIVPIVAPGGRAPGGKWSDEVAVDRPVSMNERGSAVFSATLSADGEDSVGTFRWDLEQRRVIPVAVRGMEAPDRRTFEDDGGVYASAINARDEVTFEALVRDDAGNEQDGLFFLGRDGKLRTIVLDDQTLPGGVEAGRPQLASLNDVGAVAFLAGAESEWGPPSAFVWEQRVIRPVAIVGSDAPGGGKIAAIAGLWLARATANVLVAARLDEENGPLGLYRFAAGQLTGVALPGQELPGGGRLARKSPAGLPALRAVSPANDRGQHVFLAALEGGATALYRVDGDGTLSPILRTGETLDIGKVRDFPQAQTDVSLHLNNNGQIALTARIEAAGGLRTAILMLTPAATSPR